MRNNHVETLSSDSIQGTDVYNLNDKHVGNIEELMIDLSSGRIAYAVLSFGGLLGVGDKLFAVPWQAFTIDTDNERFVLDVSKEFLEKAPGFDKNNWPEHATHGWFSDVYRYYGYEWTPERVTS